MKTFFTFLFIFFSFSLWAQKIKVSGIIVDDRAVAIPYANVAFTDVEDAANLFGALTEEDGSFMLLVPKAKYQVALSAIGADPKVIELDLRNSAHEENMGTIIISTIVDLKEVVISGTRPIYQMDLDKKTYNVSQDILAKGGSLSDVMESLPSVQVEVDGTVSLRGDQNVKILIDGRPSNLTNAADLLKTIPASSIEKIEIISSPSAKFTAEGTGGIVNVIIKRGSKSGFAGNVELFGGNPLSAGANLNLNWNKETYSIFVNSGIGYSAPMSIYDVFVDDFDATPSSSIQHSDRERGQLYYLLNTGFDKKINEHNSINANVTYRNAIADNSSFTSYEDFQDNELILISDRTEAEDEENVVIKANVGYTLNFKQEGHGLKLFYNIDNLNEDQKASIEEYERFPSLRLATQDRSNSEEQRIQHIGGINYTYPFSNGGTFEAGVQGDFFNIANDFAVERNSNNTWINILNFTNQTNYQQNVYAAYAQYKRKFDKFSFQLGLRNETSDILIETKDQSTPKNYSDWFPSAAFNYLFEGNQTLKLNLARRISRPRSTMLLPFFSFTDDRNIFVGNLDLDPSYVYAAELSYDKRLSDKFKFTPTLYYRQTNDEREIYVEKQTTIIGQEETEGFVATIVNIGNYYAYGTEIGMFYDPVKWCSMYGELTLNGFRQVGSFRDANFNGEGLLIYGRYNLTFNPFQSFKLQIQNIYRGPIETGQYQREGIYRMNLGASYDLLKGKATLSFNMRDVFNSGIVKVTTFGTDFTRELQVQYRTRQTNLSFVYRFNQKKKGAKGNRYDKFDPVN